MVQRIGKEVDRLREQGERRIDQGIDRGGWFRGDSSQLKGTEVNAQMSA